MKNIAVLLLCLLILPISTSAKEIPFLLQQATQADASNQGGPAPQQMSISAGYVCYMPQNGDPNYKNNLAAYNTCVTAQNKQNCGLNSTASTTYAWNDLASSCDVSCAKGYSRDVAGDCFSYDTPIMQATTSQSSISIVPVHATTTIVQTIYVPQVIQDEAPAPKTITKTVVVPATSTLTADISVSSQSHEETSAHSSFVQKVVNWITSLFSWL